MRITDRWPRRPLAIAAGAFAIVLVAGFVDHALSASGLPDLDPPTVRIADDPAFEERTDIREGFGRRVQVYAWALVAIVTALLAVSWRQAPPEGRRDLFADVGVLGVVLGAASLVTAALEPTLLTDGNGEGALAIPPVSMLAIAGVGALVTRLGRGAAPLSVPAEAKIAVGLALAAVGLVFVGSLGRECGEPAPGGSDTALSLAFLAGLAAGVFGLISLVRRRWLAALVALPMPLIAGIGILFAACLE